MQITWTTPSTYEGIHLKQKAFVEGKCVGWIEESLLTKKWRPTFGEPAPGSSWAQEGQVASNVPTTKTEAMAWVETMFTESKTTP
jgi:hypothetical protein